MKAFLSLPVLALLSVTLLISVDAKSQAATKMIAKHVAISKSSSVTPEVKGIAAGFTPGPDAFMVR